MRASQFKETTHPKNSINYFGSMPLIITYNRSFITPKDSTKVETVNIRHKSAHLCLACLLCPAITNKLGLLLLD